MKYFLLRLGKFLFGFIIIIIIPIIFVSNYDNLDRTISKNHNVISLQTKSSYDSLDVLFVGNSYCYSSINTKILDSLNISTFNLGISTAGVQFYELVLNDYYNNVNALPKKVLVLVTPMTFSSMSDNFIDYPIHRYLENEKSNLEIVFTYNRLNELIPMYQRSLEKFFISILNHWNSDQQDIKQYNNKGYYPSTKQFDKNTISKTEHLYKPLKKDHFDKSKIVDLLRIAKKLEEKGSEVIFFELPTNQLEKYFNDKYLSDYHNNLKYISNRYKLISIDSSLFKKENYRNIDHMNNSGANIATHEILRLLE